ncbi:hypothetical protein HDV01_001008 [Terramyces sp. JEL0728]|nr:hypothetical protein HDV01_001008 [Terramyces sp. JEL0728]
MLYYDHCEKMAALYSEKETELINFYQDLEQFIAQQSSKRNIGIQNLNDFYKHMQELKKLITKENAIEHDGNEGNAFGFVALILKKTSSVKSVMLNNDCIRQTNIEIFAEALIENSNIEAVHLTDIVIEDTHFFTKLIKPHSQIKNISIANCIFERSSFTNLCTALKYNNSIGTIKLHNLIIDQDCAKNLSDTIATNLHISELSLVKTRLDSKSLELILNGIKFNKNIKNLDISKNQIGDKGLELMGIFLQSSKSIERLVMDYMVLDIQGLMKFAVGLQKNQSLLYFSISYCQFTLEGMRYIMQSLKENYFLQELEIYHVSTVGFYDMMSDLITNNHSLSSCSFSSESTEMSKIHQALRTNYRITTLGVFQPGKQIEELVTRNLKKQKCDLAQLFLASRNITLLNVPLELKRMIFYQLCLNLLVPIRFINSLMGLFDMRTLGAMADMEEFNVHATRQFSYHSHSTESSKVWLCTSYKKLKVLRKLLQRPMSTKQPHWFKPQGTPVPKLHVYNSMTRKKEEFIPETGNQVGWYSCGPTVYNNSHLGHARNYITFDIIRRIMEDFFKFDVLYVLNITDIDDKIIVNARQHYLFSKFKKEHPTLNNELLKKLNEALEFYVNKRFGKDGQNPLGNWSMFVAEAPKSKEAAENPKFGLYLKTAQSALEALKEIKEGNSNIEKIYNSTQDVLSLWLDSQFSNTVTDPQTFRDFAAYWEEDYFNDMDSLNVKRPDVLVRVSEYVPEIVTYVEKIIANGYAYEAKGSVYFDTAKFAKAEGHAYAKLQPWSANNAKLIEDEEGELADSTGKRTPFDFALWKNSKPGEPSWNSPWGKGRPGWHIECSVMASEVLGDKMDIHTGGIDLAFPHHDNELAQAEAHYNCKQWVNYFLHAGHLHIENLKMSKSLKNFITIKEALQTNSAAQIRIMFLLHQWNAVLDYSNGSLNEAKTVENAIQNFLATVKAVVQEQKFESRESTGKHNFGSSEAALLKVLSERQNAVRAALADSFNTPGAMAEIRALVTQGNTYYNEKQKSKLKPNATVLNKVATYITQLMTTLGVFEDSNPSIGSFGSTKSSSNRDEILLPVLQTMSTFRDNVRKLAQEKADPKDILAFCDKLRDEELAEHGISLEDREDGKALIKLVDKNILLQQRNEKLEKEAQKQREKQDRVAAEAARQAERLAKGKTPPSELFKTPEYSEWDEQGLPTKDKEGAEVSKSKKKTLKKEFDKQAKLHEEYLASVEK